MKEKIESFLDTHWDTIEAIGMSIVGGVKIIVILSFTLLVVLIIGLIFLVFPFLICLWWVPVGFWTLSGIVAAVLFKTGKWKKVP